MVSITRTIILAALLILAPMSAAKADQDIGCGVGTQIWEGESGLPMKLLASWTNGITFSSISLTFGLVNCDPNRTITSASLRTRHFVDTRLDGLARDAAMGGGENLDTLATLLEVKEADRPVFSRFAQAHFNELFPSDDVTSSEMLETLAELIRDDEQLSSYAPAWALESANS